MFGDKSLDIPVYTEKVNKKLPFGKENGFNWSDLQKKGYIKETVVESDDIVTITKEFASFDGSLMKTEMLSIPAKEWNVMKAGMMSKEEAATEIKRLQIELDKARNSDKFEECAILRDKITVIEKIVVI